MLGSSASMPGSVAGTSFLVDSSIRALLFRSDSTGISIGAEIGMGAEEY